MRVSTSEGRGPVWDPAGKELLFFGRQMYMAARVETSPQLRVSPPIALFTNSFHDTGSDLREMDPARDGRILMVKEENKAMIELRVVLNWFSELHRLAPPR